MIEIILSDLEMHMADNIWEQRCKRHKNHKYNADSEQMKRNGRDGFAGELAVVQYLGIKDHMPNYENNIRPDVGEYDVRQTKYQHGKLLLHHDDPDDRITIQVTGRGRKFTLTGWILNKDGKLERLWGTLPKQPDRPAFLVPQAMLKPMHLLRKTPLTVVNG